jgi:hypothetical protein
VAADVLVYQTSRVFVEDLHGSRGMGRSAGEDLGAFPLLGLEDKEVPLVAGVEPRRKLIVGIGATVKGAAVG